MSEERDNGEKVLHLQREDYESLICVENGRPLTDFFPDGIFAIERGGEIVEVVNAPKGGNARTVRLDS